MFFSRNEFPPNGPIFHVNQYINDLVSMIENHENAAGDHEFDFDAENY